MEVEGLEILVELKSLSRNPHRGCHREDRIWYGTMTWIQDAHAARANTQLGDKEGIFGDCLSPSEGCEEPADGVVSRRSEGGIPFLPICRVPI